MYGSWVLLVLILVSSLPVIAVYLWFRAAKFQLSVVGFLLALLAGATAVFPALLLQDLLDITFSEPGRAELFYHVFFRVAFTEELSRLLMLFLFFWAFNRILDSKARDEKPNQIVTYNVLKKGTAVGLIAGLGFALLESARYAAFDMSLEIVLLRFFTATLHGACGSRIGAAAVLFRTSPVQALLRILTATAIHGVYNFMVTIPGIPSIAAILIAISAFATAIMAIRGGWAIDKTEEKT